VASALSFVSFRRLHRQGFTSVSAHWFVFCLALFLKQTRSIQLR
jgi:hypothetical protein